MTAPERRPAGLLDTSTVILLPTIEDPDILPEEPLIAAIALANGLAVYTCNPTDFTGIDGLEVIAVPVAPPDASDGADHA